MAAKLCVLTDYNLYTRSAVSWLVIVQLFSGFGFRLIVHRLFAVGGAGCMVTGVRGAGCMVTGVGEAGVHGDRCWRGRIHGDTCWSGGGAW